MKSLEDHLALDLASRPQVKWIVLDMSGVSDVDVASVDVLEELMQAYEHLRACFVTLLGWPMKSTP
jgi:ABC-type transporter Mla MlaB component